MDFRNRIPRDKKAEKRIRKKMDEGKIINLADTNYAWDDREDSKFYIEPDIRRQRLAGIMYRICPSCRNRGNNNMFLNGIYVCGACHHKAFVKDLEEKRPRERKWWQKVRDYFG